MGNRAVIAFENKSNATGIYLHWNGGRDSVEGFLEAGKHICRLGDSQYALARLIQIIGQYFGGNTSVGVGPLSELDCDNGNNGLYIVDPNTFKIIDRLYHSGPEQQEHDLEEFKQYAINRVENGTNYEEPKDNV